MRLPSRLPLGLVALLGVVLTLSWAVQHLRPDRPGDSPLASTPVEAEAVVWADVAALRRAELWPRDGVDDACAAAWTGGIDELTVFFRGEDEPFDRLGVIARGEVARGAGARETLLGCVSDGADPSRFRPVEVAGTSALMLGSGSYAAFVGRDGVVSGDRDSVAAAIGATRGEPSGEEGALLRLWDAVAIGRQLIAAMRLSAEHAEALGALAGGLSPELRVLGEVRGVGLGVRLESALHVLMTLETRDPAAAEALLAALRAALPRLDRGWAGRILDELLTTVDGRVHDRDVILSAGPSETALEDLRTVLLSMGPGAPRARGMLRNFP